MQCIQLFIIQFFTCIIFFVPIQGMQNTENIRLYTDHTTYKEIDNKGIERTYTWHKPSDIDYEQSHIEMGNNHDNCFKFFEDREDAIIQRQKYNEFYKLELIHVMNNIEYYASMKKDPAENLPQVKKRLSENQSHEEIQDQEQIKKPKR